MFDQSTDMLHFLADHNFDDQVVVGVLARDPSVAIIRVRELGMAQSSDEELLEWAATSGHVILTHDENTMVGFAYDRVTAGQPMPGVVLVHQWLPVSRAIDDVLYLAQAGVPADFDCQVIHVPLPL